MLKILNTHDHHIRSICNWESKNLEYRWNFMNNKPLFEETLYVIMLCKNPVTEMITQVKDSDRLAVSN